MSAGRAVGSLSRTAEHKEREFRELTGETARATTDLARGLGLEEKSVLHKKAHKRLAEQVLVLAQMDVRLDMQVTATTRAIKTVALEEDRKRTKAQGAEGGAAEDAKEMDMAGFSEMLKAKVAAAMQGADKKALESRAYKGVVKHVVAAEGDEEEDDVVMESDTQVSLICPVTGLRFNNPVQSKKCKHTYDNNGIRQHVRIGGGKASCPVAGCSHKVALADLVVDKDMARRVRIESQTGDAEDVLDAENVDDDSVGETYL